MTAKAAESHSLGPGVAGDDLVRILTKLTHDVERFDSVVLRQREMLEHLAGHLNDLDPGLLHQHSERISLEAAEMVACARQALEQLSQLAEPAASRSRQDTARGRSRRMSRDRRRD